MKQGTSFRGTSGLAHKVRAARSDVMRLIGEAGGTGVHVFGALAAGTDGPAADVNLLFEAARPLGVTDLGRLEARVAAVIGADVYLVPADTLRPPLRDEVLAEAVPL